MAKKTLKADLSVKSINKLIKDIKSYQTDFNKKMQIFVRKLAESGIPVIDSNMEKANFTYDSNGIQSGTDTTHTTKVKVTSNESVVTAVLTAKGEEILFIEFGAGIYYNGSVGSSPHPKGEEFGYLIGTYGKGYGSKKVWGYYDDSGKLILTYGVEATMPMYRASLEMANNVVRIAREVF